MTAAPTKPNFPREQALVVAEEIYTRLKPFTERCKIVGSLRRHCKTVHDIEVLYISKITKVQVGLFEGEFAIVNAAEDILNRWLREAHLAKRKGKDGVTSAWGPQNKLAVHVASGIPVDFFSTTEEKWHVALVIRTGGKRTNLALTMGANKRGLTLNSYGSGFTDMKTGEKIICQSEENVFWHAGVPYAEPQFRP